MMTRVNKVSQMLCVYKYRISCILILIFMNLCYIVMYYYDYKVQESGMNLCVSVQHKEEEVQKRPKFILLWTNKVEPLSTFLEGQKAFYKYECPVKNCYVTNDRTFFAGNLSYFDAIMFNGRSLTRDVNAYPKERYAHQKYVYANLETASLKICCSFLDGFFNWTATYKFNSDVILKYYSILNKTTKEPVGPRTDMHWVQDMKEIDDEFATTLKSKTKAAMWLVNNCNSQQRNGFVKNLQEMLRKFNLTVDVFGHCGPYKCPRNRQAKCASIIKKYYYFYMALENSFHEDYVTEKVLHAFLNNAVPIVLGGANYSRFLPPGSYINGKEYNAEELAAIMNNLIQNPDLYKQYFRWRNHYEFVSTMPEDQSGNDRLFNFTKYEGEGICNFCAALNDKKKFETHTVYKNIRSWWQ